MQRKSFYGTMSRRRFAPHVLLCILVTSLVVILNGVGVAAGEPPNRLKRMEVRSTERYTRLLFVFDRTPRYSLSYLPGRQVQLTFHETGGTAFRKYRSFSDTRLSDISLSDRGDRLRLRFSFKEKSPGFRLVDSILPNVVTLDVGEALQRNGAASMPPGREPIWNGAGKLIHEFDPSHSSDIPFFPTPGVLIRKLLSPADGKLFLRGEEALYRERGAEAEEIFTTFVNQGNLIRAIACFRLGEAQYLLRKYESALRWFREGARIQPDFMVHSPSIVFAFADTLVRNGETEAGRTMLERLTVGMADTKYGPLLLVRMADVMTRGGRHMDALALYRTVVNNFPESRGSLLASLRLADRRFFQVSTDTYRGLSGEYLKIARTSGDPLLKEESYFKGALLEALYGGVADAVSAVTTYEKSYPAGVFTNVARTMREDLLLLLYHELERAGDCKGLVRLALDNREYLAKCTGERSFIPRIDECFRKLGLFGDELELFCQLVETEWAAANAPLLYGRIFDISFELEDFARAEAAGKVFLERFSGDDRSGSVRERLAGIQYRNRDLQAVFRTLSPLFSGNGSARYPESHYYFGKACASSGDMARAEQSMIRYLARVGDGGESFLSSDARVVAAAARLARKDAAGAMELYRAGYEAARGEQKEMFLYKMGDLSLREGRHEEARSRWQQLVREGTDPVWTRMASQALADMDWGEKWGTKGTSK